MQLEYKSLPLELLDMNVEHGTATIAHATYDNIDLLNDICRKGMFNKSWQENKAVKFVVNHDERRQIGKVVKLYEDDKHGYTNVKFSKSQIGQDYLIKVDEGIIDSASFGFWPTRANKIEVKGKTVRELKEVIHGETTLVDGLIPINPLSKVKMVTKAGDDLVIILNARLAKLENFIRNTKASDECILECAEEVKAIQSLLISSEDTAATSDGTQTASDDENEAVNKRRLHYLTLLNLQI